MKKILSVFVAIVFCLCVCCSTAFAADTSSITALIEDLGIDIGSKGLSNSELSSIIGNLNLEGFDVETIKNAFDNNDTQKMADIEAALKNLEAAAPNAGAANSSGVANGSGGSSGSGSGLDALSGLLGGIDLSSIGSSLSSGDALSTITGMFSGIDTSSFDVSALMNTISSAFSSGGLDLGSLTSGMDVGSFDIGSVLSGGGATDTISTIMDALMSGLSALGLDTSMLDGLMDSDIINFFANLFMGIGGGSDSSANNNNSATLPSLTTTASVTTTAAAESAVAPSTSPSTGDTSAVVVALGTISVACAAAFVCMKKKKD